jgi:hypothetical protein
MLSDAERDALTWWYERDEVLEPARALASKKAYLELEDYVLRLALLPLSNHAELPERMRTEDGEPLFPTNLDPTIDEEKWQDAVDVGWDVVKAKLGVSKDEVHRNIRDEQARDWEAFIESAERRKRERSE